METPIIDITAKEIAKKHFPEDPERAEGLEFDLECYAAQEVAKEQNTSKKPIVHVKI